ncbi:helix-turn-helix domain-containing protein [Ehrlichia japonica]|uniref:Helix-turn-helix domain protein n=1 Tax=Ehrlichia japonica TaxID=391036 RepID=X5H3K5_9RICK|nr:XRE family transcriptional regulator [Ehrlichia japonica]AHX04655.1 helix-turn-helix domain protein [Ehrlichia japonica]
MTTISNQNDYGIKYKILKLIKDITHKNYWNQVTTAKILGVDQPKISQISNGKTAGFSLERLLIFLLRLKCEVSITITVNNSEIKSINKDNTTENSLESINLVIVQKGNE